MIFCQTTTWKQLRKTHQCDGLAQRYAVISWYFMKTLQPSAALAPIWKIPVMQISKVHNCIEIIESSAFNFANSKLWSADSKIIWTQWLQCCQWMSVATVGHGDMVGHGTQRSGLWGRPAVRSSDEAKPMWWRYSRRTLLKLRKFHVIHGTSFVCCCCCCCSCSCCSPIPWKNQVLECSMKVTWSYTVVGGPDAKTCLVTGPGDQQRPTLRTPGDWVCQKCVCVIANSQKIMLVSIPYQTISSFIYIHI